MARATSAAKKTITAKKTTTTKLPKAVIKTTPDFEFNFQVGDLAVYPAHGVGKIIALENKEVGGCHQQFYIMKIKDSGMTIMIPTTNVKSVGLRSVISKENVKTVFDVIGDRSATVPDNQTWNRRYREYMEKIKTGSLFDIACVFRDLHLLKLTKDLSFGERKLYDLAFSLLGKEISIASDSTEEKVTQKLESLFKDCPSSLSAAKSK